MPKDLASDKVLKRQMAMLKERLEKEIMETKVGYQSEYENLYLAVCLRKRPYTYNSLSIRDFILPKQTGLR
jgi:hypothetical protein